MIQISSANDLFDVKVFFNTSVHVFRVSKNDTFGDLKGKFCQMYPKVLTEDIQVFYFLSLQFVSMVCVPKANYIPFHCDPVVAVLEREENAFTGEIFIQLVDIRKEIVNKPTQINTFDSNYDEIFSGKNSTKNRVSNGYMNGCTEWIPQQQQNPVSVDAGRMVVSSLPGISESLFWELSNLAVIQGKLQKKVILNKKQEVWRDMYVILERDRIWMFNQQTPARVPAGGGGAAVNGAATYSNTHLPHEKEHIPPSYIPLPSVQSSSFKLVAQIVDSCVFSVTIDSNESVHETVTFRTKSMEATENWVKAFYKISESIRRKQLIKKSLQQGANEKMFGVSAASHRSAELKESVHVAAALQRILSDDEEDCYSLNDNDCIANIEATVTRSQLEVSDAQIKTVGYLSSFDGMLQCSYLRGYFQKYLMANSVEESLLFWEYAEDFRRGHPQADDPFRFASAQANNGIGNAAGSNECSATDDGTVTEATVDTASRVLNWAENIYSSFVEACAFYQVGDVDDDQMAAIGGAIRKNKNTLNMLASRVGGSVSIEGKVPILGCDLFAAVQKAAYNKLKYQYYPEFVKQLKYSKLLKAALHAYERSRQRLSIMSTVLKSDSEAPADRGIVPLPLNGNDRAGSPKTTAADTKATVAPAIRFPLFSRLTSRANVSDGTNKKGSSTACTTGDASGHGLTVMSTPWRRNGIPVFDQLRADSRNANKARGVQRPLTGRRDSPINWMPDWWWDYIHIDHFTYTVDEEQRRAWAEKEHDQQVKAVEQERQYRAAALQRKSLAKLAMMNVSATESTETPKEDGSERAPSTAVPTSSNMSENTLLRTMAAGGEFDSDVDTDEEGDEGAAVDRLTMLVSYRNGTHHLYPHWMPINMEEVLTSVQQKTEAVVKSNRARDDLNSTVHRELLLRNQTQDLVDSIDAMPALADPNAYIRSVYTPRFSSADYKTVETVNKQLLMDLRKSFVNTSFGPYQPHSFLNSAVPSGLGTVVLSAAVRVRYYKRKKPTTSTKSAPPTTGNRPSSMSFSMQGSSRLSTKSGSFSGPPMGGGGGGAGGSPPSVHGKQLLTSQQSMRGVDVAGSSAGSHVSLIREIMVAEPPITGSSGGGSSAAANQQSFNPRRGLPRTPSEEFLGAHNSSGIEWMRQFALITVCLGEPRIVLFDPVTLAHTATISLNEVTKLQPSIQSLHAIDVIDEQGLIWQILPEGVDEEDSRLCVKKWLELLSVLTQPQRTEIVHIVRSGFLQKRGQYNKAFKQRWFVLTSDYRLSYYKDDAVNSPYKGEIKLEFSSTSTDIIRFNREIIMSMKEINRTFILQADDGKEAEEWIQLIYALIDVRKAAPPSPCISLGGGGGVSDKIFSLAEEDDDDEGEDEDDDEDEE